MEECSATNVTLIRTISTSTSSSQCPVASNGTFLALSHSDAEFGIWSLNDVHSMPLVLKGSRREITALAFGHESNPTLICSAAEDNILVWNVNKARESYEAGKPLNGQVIGRALGKVNYCSFSPGDKCVAACINCKVYILNSKKEEVFCVLKGHLARVGVAKFCLHHESVLVTISDDRTFRIWDTNQYTLVHKSHEISSSPLTTLAVDLLNKRFAIGTSNGLVYIINSAEGSDFQILHELDVFKLIKNYCLQKKLPSFQENTRLNQSKSESNIEVGSIILDVYYCYNITRSHARKDECVKVDNSWMQKKQFLNELLDEPSRTLLVGVPGALVCTSMNTLECLEVVDLYCGNVNLPNKTHCLPLGLATSGSLHFAQQPGNEVIWCLAGDLLGSSVSVMEWRPELLRSAAAVVSRGAKQPLQHNIGHQEELVMVARTPLCSDSPLRTELIPKGDICAEFILLVTALTSVHWTVVGWHSGKLGVTKKKTVSDQPLTFKSKVKSSGYRQCPRMSMFKPDISSFHTKNIHREPVQKCGSSLNLLKIDDEPITDIQPFTNLRKSIRLTETPTRVTHIHFSGDGGKLACGLANSSVEILRSQFSKKGTCLIGHKGSINTVNWSYNNEWLITASDDKTASVWISGQTDPIMNFTEIYSNFHVDKGTYFQNQSDAKFLHKVKAAQFYYMDQFILLTSGGTFYLYKFHLDPTRHDIKRYLTKSKYKLVKRFSTEALQITAMAAVNSFYSYIVLCAGSNKKIEIYDMNVGEKTRTICDVHERPPHQLVINEGSLHTALPPDGQNLFLTAAAADCIKLWDLRISRCVKLFEGHQNRVHSCGVAFSPCGRYIAAGSEDKTAYIFDVRTGTYCHKLLRHSDVVTSVAFNQSHQQIVTATLDGQLYIFSNS